MNKAEIRAKFVCTHCGYHPNSRADWCGKGCGSDYNKMIDVSQVHNEAIEAAAKKSYFPEAASGVAGAIRRLRIEEKERT